MISSYEVFASLHVLDDTSSDVTEEPEQPVLEKTAAEARSSQDQNGNMAADCTTFTEEVMFPVVSK